MPGITKGKNMNKPTFKWGSIKFRVTLFTLAIFLVSIWSLAFYATRTLQKDIEQLTQEQQLSTVSFVAADVNDELETRLEALARVASEIRPHMLKEPRALQTLLEQRPLLQILFNGGAFATGSDGVAIADVPLSAKRVGVNYLDRTSVSVPLKEGKAMVGRPAMGKMLAAPVFSLSVPLRDEKGTVIGVLVGTINLNRPSFLDQITDNRYGKTGGYLLVAPQHRLIVTATDKSLIMAPLPPPGANRSIDRFVQGGEGAEVFVNPQGVEVLAAVKRISVAGWYVVAALPTVEAFAPIREMNLRILMATILLSATTVVLIWWMLKKQLAPMFATVTTLAGMSDNDRPLAALPITKQDEIGELIGGFNHLLEIIGQREDALYKSERFMRIVTDNIPGMVGYWDHELRCRFANSAYLEWFGRTQEQMGGIQIRELLGDELFSKNEQYIRGALRGERQKFERTLVKCDGSISHTIAQYIPDREGDRVRGFFVLVADVTELKRAEQLLSDLNQRLSEMNEHLLAAQEQERISIARDIHDDLGQTLTVLKLDLESIERRIPADCADLNETAFSMRRNLDQVSAKIQQIAANLRPPLLDNLGLTAAIEWQVNELRKRSGMEFFLMLNEEADNLDQKTSTVVMRIVQEALTNIVRHARATEVTISLCKREKNLFLEISDNGCGITADQLSSPKSYGVMGMSERAKSCRGELTITGDEGRGTKLCLTIPIENDLLPL